MAKITRRQFLKYSAIAGAAAVVPWKIAMREAWAQYGFNSPNLTKFVDPIRPVGVIPIAAADGFNQAFTSPYGSWNANHNTINIVQFQDVPQFIKFCLSHLKYASQNFTLFLELHLNLRLLKNPEVLPSDF